MLFKNVFHSEKRIYVKTRNLTLLKWLIGLVIDVGEDSEFGESVNKYSRAMSHFEYIFLIYFWTFESREKKHLAPFPKRLSPKWQLAQLPFWVHLSSGGHRTTVVHGHSRPPCPGLWHLCTCPWRLLSLDDLSSHGIIWHRIYRTRALCLSDIIFILSHFITELFC